MKRAFTLIELLVVIAILAILAAILFPVFASAKEAAKKTSALSNTKQDLTSSLIYMGDSDDMVVPLEVSPGGYNDHFAANVERNVITRGQLIQPYMKSWQLMVHPMDPNTSDAVKLTAAGFPAGSTGAMLEHARGVTTNHGYNYFYMSPFNADSRFVPVSATSFARPAQTVMIVDTIWDKTGPRAPSGGGNWFVQAPSYWNSPTAFWFGAWAFTDPSSWFQFGGAYDFSKGTVTVGYTDGHAKSHPIPVLWAGANPATSSVFDPEKYIWGGHN